MQIVMIQIAKPPQTAQHYTLRTHMDHRLLHTALHRQRPMLDLAIQVSFQIQIQVTVSYNHVHSRQLDARQHILLQLQR